MFQLLAIIFLVHHELRYINNKDSFNDKILMAPLLKTLAFILSCSRSKAKRGEISSQTDQHQNTTKNKQDKGRRTSHKRTWNTTYLNWSFCERWNYIGHIKGTVTCPPRKKGYSGIASQETQTSLAKSITCWSDADSPPVPFTPPVRRGAVIQHSSLQHSSPSTSPKSVNSILNKCLIKNAQPQKPIYLLHPPAV